MKMFSVLAVLCVFVTGCVTPSFSSMNIQRSGIRSTGDMATTVALDSVLLSEADSTKVKTREIALAVQLFLKDGKVADLTIPEISSELKKIIPESYYFMLDILIAQIQGITVDTQVIGANNLERLNSVCVGVINSCNLYDVKYRPDLTESDAKSLVREIKQDVNTDSRFGKKFVETFNK